MATDIKRMRYFDGLFMKQEEFNLEQNYHRRLRHLHNTHLHGCGIAFGLKLEAGPGSEQISVTPGMGIDKVFDTTYGENTGREIVVVQNQIIDISSYDPFDAVYVWVSYSEREADIVPDRGGTEPIHLLESATISHDLTPPIDTEEHLLLGKVVIKNDHTVDADGIFETENGLPLRRELPGEEFFAALRIVTDSLVGRRINLREVRPPSKSFPFFRLTGPSAFLDEREWPELVSRWRNIRLEIGGLDTYSFSGSGTGGVVTITLDPGERTDRLLEILANDLIAHGGRPIQWRTVTLPEDAGNLTAGDYAIIGFNETRREIRINSPATIINPGTLQFFPHRVAGASNLARHFNGGLSRHGAWRNPGDEAPAGLEVYEYGGEFNENGLPERPTLEVFEGGFQRALIRARFDGSVPADTINVYWSESYEPTPGNHDGSFSFAGPGPHELQHDGLTENEVYYYIATAGISGNETEYAPSRYFYEERKTLAEYTVPGTYSLVIPENLSVTRLHLVGGGGGGGAAPEAGAGPGGEGGSAGESSTFDTGTAAGGAGGGGGGSDDTPGAAGEDSSSGPFAGGTGGSVAGSGAAGEPLDDPPFRDEGAGGEGAAGAGGKGGRGAYFTQDLTLTPLNEMSLTVGAGGAGGQGPGDPGADGAPGLVLLEI